MFSKEQKTTPDQNESDAIAEQERQIRSRGFRTVLKPSGSWVIVVDSAAGYLRDSAGIDGMPVSEGCATQARAIEYVDGNFGVLCSPRPRLFQLDSAVKRASAAIETMEGGCVIRSGSSVTPPLETFNALVTACEKFLAEHEERAIEAEVRASFPDGFQPSNR